MLKLIKKGSGKLGIDGAIAFTVLSKIIQAGGGVMTLLFVVKCLTKVEQGYYYTFGSILAIQTFFELGLSSIMILYVAHENSNLTWTDRISFSGSEESGSRLASLLRFTVKWFVVVSALLLIALIITGYLFFNKFGKNNIDVDWQAPWIIISITTALSLMVSPILAFFEGLGRIKEVAKIRMLQQMVQLSMVFLFFFLGFKLFSSPIAALLAFLIVPIWIFFGEKKKLLIFIWNKLDKWHVNYRLEIFPYQWKIALSWISGYFIFQLFNPVLFATEGAVVAGQMGMTLTVLNSFFAIAFSWISTKVPTISGLIAQKDYENLDKLFNKTLMQSTILNAMGLTVIFGVIFVLRHFDIKIGGKNFADRFLSYLPMFFMMVPILLNHISASWITYLRCHKEEPMLINSIVIGVFCCLSTIILGNWFGVIGMTLGYMILTIISFIWTYIIFVTKKKEWHS